MSPSKEPEDGPAAAPDENSGPTGHRASEKVPEGGAERRPPRPLLSRDRERQGLQTGGQNLWGLRKEGQSRERQVWERPGGAALSCVGGDRGPRAHTRPELPVLAQRW